MTPDPAPQTPAPLTAAQAEAAFLRLNAPDAVVIIEAEALDRDRAARDALPSAERLAEALEDMIVWLEAEAAHPRPDPRPAMRLQAQYARAALAASPSPEDHHD